MHQRLISLVVFALFLETERARCLCLGVRLQRNLHAMILLGCWCMYGMPQRLISLVVFAFVLGNGAGQVPVPRSEIAERSLCNDFAWSLMHVRFASALDQIGRFRFAPASE